MFKINKTMPTTGFEDIEIYDYTERSFVIRGETRQYKDDLRTLGGTWNSRLTDKDSGDKFGGWIFPESKRLDIETWKSKGKHIAVEEEDYQPRQYAPKTEVSRSSGSDRVFLQRIEARLERMEKMLMKLTGCEGESTEEVIESDDSDEKEAMKPRPRLMRNKKK